LSGGSPSTSPTSTGRTRSACTASRPRARPPSSSRFRRRRRPILEHRHHHHQQQQQQPHHQHHHHQHHRPGRRAGCAAPCGRSRGAGAGVGGSVLLPRRAGAASPLGHRPAVGTRFAHRLLRRLRRRRASDRPLAGARATRPRASAAPRAAPPVKRLVGWRRLTRACARAAQWGTDDPEGFLAEFGFSEAQAVALGDPAIAHGALAQPPRAASARAADLAGPGLASRLGYVGCGAQRPEEDALRHGLQAPREAQHARAPPGRCQEPLAARAPDREMGSRPCPRLPAPARAHAAREAGGLSARAPPCGEKMSVY